MVFQTKSRFSAEGKDVWEYKIGDRVAAFHRIGEPCGRYAEYAITPASTTFLMPPNISFEAGAGLSPTCVSSALPVVTYQQRNSLPGGHIIEKAQMAGENSK